MSSQLFQTSNADAIKDLKAWLSQARQIIEARKKVGDAFKALARKGAVITPLTPRNKTKWQKHIPKPSAFLEASYRQKKQVVQGLMADGLIKSAAGIKDPQWVRYFEKLMTANANPLRFVRFILGPVGTGKTHTIRALLDPKHWLSVWINPDDLNNKARLQKIFSGNTSNAKSIRAHSSKRPDRRNRIYVIDDVEAVKKATSTTYILDQVTTSKHPMALAKIFKRQRIMTPVIFICSSDRYHLASKLQRWSPTPIVHWAKPTIPDLRRYAAKVCGINPVYAMMYANRAYGDFRGIRLQSDPRDPFNSPEAIFECLVSGDTEKVHEEAMNGYKLSMIMEASWPAYVSGLGGMCTMADALSEQDLLTPGFEMRSEANNYKFLLAQAFTDTVDVPYDPVTHADTMHGHWKMMARYRVKKAATKSLKGIQ